jgi:SAM-dependent methyltransferase
MRAKTIAYTMAPQLKRWSYSSIQMGLGGRAIEIFYLLKSFKKPPSQRARSTLETCRNTRSRVMEMTGLQLERRKVLDIGPGQQLRHMKCFAQSNDVVGIDVDFIPQKLGPKEMWQLARVSPLLRTVKTVVRKQLGFDEQFDQALAKELGVSGFPPLPILRMSASSMSFPDASFDFVCSYSAFGHMSDPKAALQEVRRVLRPGGVAYISLHLYTSHSGCLDPAIIGKDELEAPFWPHLRPSWIHAVQPAAYLNELRLPAWKKMFEEVMPGTRFIHETQDELATPLSDLRQSGELTEYSDEELLTLNLIGVWQKPREAERPRSAASVEPRRPTAAAQLQQVAR